MPYRLFNTDTWKRLTGLSLLLAAILLPALVTADRNIDNARLAELDVERVRELKKSGDIMPLEQLLSRVRQDYPGRVIEIELDEDDNRYIYEMEIVDADGIVWEIDLDARTGDLLEREREND